MLNGILYAIFGNPALVRIAKGALAFAIAAGGTYLATESGTAVDSGALPELTGAVLGVLALGFEKLAGELDSGVDN